MKEARQKKRTDPRRERDAVNEEQMSGAAIAVVPRRVSGFFAKHTGALQAIKTGLSEEIDLVEMGSFALRTKQSGWALVKNDGIALTNAEFLRLGQLGDAMLPWTRVPTLDESAVVGVTTIYPELQDLALDESRLLMHAETPVRSARFARGPHVIEVVTEVGRPAHTIVVVVRDVTEAIRAETTIALLKSRFLQQEHVRTMGELVTGITHDLNNQLGALAMRLSIAQEDETCRRAQGDNLDAIERIVTSCLKSVASLQRTPESPSIEAVDVREFVASAIEMAAASLRRESATNRLVRVRSALPPLPKVKGNAAELRHVMIHLLLNARDAMPGGGTVNVSGIARGGAVVIHVEDEGSGIPEQNLERIFEPFFTTKGANGTGVGLALARETIERFGGFIRAYNREAGGACFELGFIPARPEPIS